MSIWDSIYYKEVPTKFKYLIFPSKYSDNDFLKQKFIKVVQELHEKTGCNNQIIDIEFFLVDNKPLVMEINPRIGGNYLPIYHITGYNNFLVSEELKKGVIPKKTEKIGFGVCRYNYGRGKNNDVVILSENTNIFSVNSGTNGYYHTYSFSYKNDLDKLIENVEKEYKKIRCCAFCSPLIPISSH